MGTYVVAVLALFFALVAMWGNWIYLDDDSLPLPTEKRPSFWRFCWTLVTRPFVALGGFKPSANR